MTRLPASMGPASRLRTRQAGSRHDSAPSPRMLRGATPSAFGGFTRGVLSALGLDRARTWSVRGLRRAGGIDRHDWIMGDELSALDQLDYETLETLALRTVSQAVRHGWPPAARLVDRRGSQLGPDLAGGDLDDLDARVRTDRPSLVLLFERAADPEFDLTVAALTESFAVAWDITLGFDGHDARLVDYEPVFPSGGHRHLQALLAYASDR